METKSESKPEDSSIEKRLAFIILDVVAIIAILSIVLLADLSEQPEKTTFQKLIIGGAVKPIGINPVQFPERENPCRIIRCDYSQQAEDIGTTQSNLALCQCPNGNVYQISRIQYYAGNYASEHTASYGVAP